MSDYINPKSESKEAFLQREATVICRNDFLKFSASYPDKAVLCLVDNGMFTACVVANSHEDAILFADPNDPRERMYYLIDRSKLEGNINGRN